MWDEFKKSMLVTLYERSVSPLFATFIMSWLVWNWKLIIILMGTEKYMNGETKNFYINQSLASINTMVYGPAITTFVWIVFYPILALISYSICHYFAELKNTIKNKIEKNQLITLRQSLLIKKEMKDMDENYASLLQKSEQQTIELNKLLDDKVKEIVKLNDDNSRLEQNILELTQIININIEQNKTLTNTSNDDKKKIGNLQRERKGLEDMLTNLSSHIDDLEVQLAEKQKNKTLLTTR